MNGTYSESFTLGSDAVTFNTTTTESWSPEEMPHKVLLATIVSFVAAVGTIGNILIIYSVITQQELRRLTGNMFVCNLAVADLIVTALLLPITALNILNDNVSILPERACQFIGFMLPLTCNASIQNLMFISVQRLWLTTSAKHKVNFLKSPLTTFLLVVFVWIWSAMLVAPVLVPLPSNGNILLIYDTGANMCAWDDKSVPSFIISMILFAYFIPLAISIFCYWLLFRRVKRKSKEMSMRSHSVSPQMRKREARLLKTIMIVLVCFLVSWTPYCSTILLSSFGLVNDIRSPSIKRPTAWLGMVNSTANSFIYGWRNENFRQGYISCALQIADCFTCGSYIGSSFAGAIVTLIMKNRTAIKRRTLSKKQTKSSISLKAFF